MRGFSKTTGTHPVGRSGSLTHVYMLIKKKKITIHNVLYLPTNRPGLVGVPLFQKAAHTHAPFTDPLSGHMSRGHTYRAHGGIYMGQ